MPSFTLSPSPGAIAGDTCTLPPPAPPIPPKGHERGAAVPALHSLAELLSLHWHAQIPPAGPARWNLLRSEAERLRTLAGALLCLANAESARPLRVLVPLDPLVRDLAGALAARYPRARVTIAPLGHVEADERLLVCLWSHLLANAFKYSQRNDAPRIHVSARTTPGAREFSVSDNGVGIAEDQVERIFEPFYRSARPRPADGHRLGLATVRAIAQAHGGDAWAVRDRADGAEVRFSLRDRIHAGLPDHD